MDDSDMEYLDLSEEHKYEDDSESQSDYSDYDPSISFEDFAVVTEGSTDGYRKRGRRRSTNPKKKKKPKSECIPMQCEQCDTVLTGISSLKAHVKRMHLKQRDFLCHICSKEFFTTTHREDHIISVHTRRCKACQKDLVETEPWSEGMDKTKLRTAKCPCGNDVHYISKVGRVKCIRDDDVKPKKKRSPAELVPMTCEQCGLVVTGKSSLLAHTKRQHLREFDHKCTICSKEFFSTTHLQTHMLSLHTRKCQNCDAFVMEEEPWTESMNRRQERKVTCKCGTEVSIFTKLGPKHRHGDGEPPARKKPRQKQPTDTRYVCGTCGKIFLKKNNAMTHICTSKLAEKLTLMTVKCTYAACEQAFQTEREMKDHYKAVHEPEYVVPTENVEFKMEGDDFILEEGSQVVMYEPNEDRKDSAITSIQIMHDGKLVPAEQVVDEHGNISFIIKDIE